MERKTCTTTSSTSVGTLLGIISGISISGATFLVKYMPNIHPGQHAIFRCWIIAAISLPQLVYRHENPLGPPQHRISILIGALAHGTFLLFQFITFKYLPLGEATVLISSYPAFVTVAGRILLKEMFGFLEVIAVLLTIIGMIFITGFHKTIGDNYREYSTESLYGLAAAAAAIFSAVLVYIVYRKLRKIHFSVMLFNSGTVGLIESLILTKCMGSFSLPLGGLQNSFILLLGFLSYLGTFCALYSVRYGEAGHMSTVRASSEIFFSFLWQVTIFGNLPDAMTVFGSAAVCLSIILIGFKQRFRNVLLESWMKLC